ncbi:hypothetical protein ABPG75_009788 [Micractinium tetrahymenae]
MAGPVAHPAVLASCRRRHAACATVGHRRDETAHWRQRGLSLHTRQAVPTRLRILSFTCVAADSQSRAASRGLLPAGAQSLPPLPPLAALPLAARPGPAFAAPPSLQPAVLESSGKLLQSATVGQESRCF